MDWGHYLELGKYGPYIWSCYILSALMLVGNLVAALRAHRKEYLRVQRRRIAEVQPARPSDH